MTNINYLQIPLDAATAPVVKLWCCVSKQHNWLAKYTLALTEAESKALLLDGALADWKYFEREHGWACVPVTIQIQEK